MIFELHFKQDTGTRTPGGAASATPQRGGASTPAMAAASVPPNEATKLLLARLLEVPASVHFRVLPDPVLHVRAPLRALGMPCRARSLPAAPCSRAAR